MVVCVCLGNPCCSGCSCFLVWPRTFYLVVYTCRHGRKGERPLRFFFCCCLLACLPAYYGCWLALFGVERALWLRGLACFAWALPLVSVWVYVCLYARTSLEIADFLFTHLVFYFVGDAPLCWLLFCYIHGSILLSPFSFCFIAGLVMMNEDSYCFREGRG